MSDEVHRLEASAPQTGGLVIKKKNVDEKKDVFKIPKSKFGLDILAKKLKKERETGLLSSFKDDDEEVDAKKAKNEENDDGVKFKKSLDLKSKHYRVSDPETPSYKLAVTKSVRQHFNERISDKSKGLYTSTKNREKYRDDRRSHKGSGRDRERGREYDRKRSRHSSSRSNNSRRDRDRSNRYRDETPETPRQHYEGKSSMSKSSWDDDDEDEWKSKKKRSSWDFPTPKFPHKNRPDDSIRSNRSNKSIKKFDDDTPRPTPAHKFNKWAADRKHSGATPRVEGGTDKPWENEEDRGLWEEEQIRLDREWYNMDEGYDDENNPFAGASADYLKKREEQIELKKRKRISAQQRQINKDNELWEKNRMITSGVVQKINFNEDFEEETIERVNLLVHHAVPPFLDGRIVFTKVMGKKSVLNFDSSI